MRKASAVCLAVAALLSACGGGGGGSSPGASSQTAVPSVSPQGFWQGSTNNGRTIQALVLENGQYYTVYSSNNVIYGMVEGSFTVNGNTISDSSARDFQNGLNPVSGSLTGTVSAGQSISGTIVEAGNSISFNGTYSTAYDAPATLSQAVGTWTGSSIVNPGGAVGSTTITVDSTGQFTGFSSTCNFTGSLKPRSSGKGVFDGTVTFAATGCVLPGASVPFEAVTAKNSNGTTGLLAAGVTSGRDHDFLFSALKS
ncbi:hypothetical protein [Paraburkholderia sp. HD33-4]|uniref:hypothetical protein n=1 Tax=Paraburkholderia sp. HD33-4 TaxID=2883242 RepID=UPI001F435937|nr:hypothetical protein [Paraburkholderia sp. HD33-4]